MVSSHFPITFGNDSNWAILAAIALIGAGIRHYFNLKSKGHHNVWILPVATVAIFALAFVIRPQKQETSVANASMPYSEISSIIQNRCMSCHAEKPTYPGMTAPPKGVMYNDPKVVQAIAPKIKLQLETNVMPPGNLTEMTEEERQKVIAWVDAGAQVP